MEMDKREQIREELDEWLAEGKIDRATYDQLLAEQLGEAPESLTGGLMTGAAGLVMGEGIGVLILKHFEWQPVPVWRWSLLATLVLLFAALQLVRVRERAEAGRALAIAASGLWTQVVFFWGFTEFPVPPEGMYFSTVFALLALGHLVIAYLATSSFVVVRVCFWLLVALFLYLVESDDGSYQFGDYLSRFALLGAVFLFAAREHLVLRWPGGGIAMRFARAYQVVGLEIINRVAYGLAWYGWSGEAYSDVGMRLLCVAGTIVLFGLEVWAGQRSRMPWVSVLGVLHFLMQIQAILSYPYISLEQRALLVIGFALLLILVAQGESSTKKSSAP